MPHDPNPDGPVRRASETDTLAAITRRIQTLERQFGLAWCGANPEAFAKLYAALIVTEKLSGPKPRRR